MKKLFTLLFALVATTTIWAYDFKSGDLYYNITSSSEPYTVEVTYQYEWSETNYSSLTTVAIPESVTRNGITYSVTSIGERAFYECQSLTSVTIPNSVTSIGGYAFVSCDSLTSITIPESITSIGESAFAYCRNMKSVVWNAINCADFSYSSYEGPFGDQRYNSAITSFSFTFGDSVQHIPAYLCYGMSMLKSITIPNSVTSIGTQAFYGCSGLTSVVWNAINCADFLSDSRSRPFGYNSITSFTIGDSVKHIPAYLCSGMTKLTSVTLPNSVTSVGNAAFYECSGLTSPVYNSHSFAYMPTSYQGDYVIPEGIKQIAGSAFRGCVGLTSVTIPNSVTSIGDYAFDGCSGLTSPVYNSHSFAYMPTSYQGDYVIPEGIKQIAGAAFRDCSGLRSITIPNSLTSIGDWAFNGCSSLTSVTTGNGLTSIGDFAFYECSSLTSVTTGNGLTSIGECAFYGCSSLTSVTTGNGLTSIGDYTFDGCSSLTSITIPNSVTSIGECAFYGCSGLKSINIPNSLTSIERHTFDGCSSLTSITIPNSVTSIGYSAFSRCSGLTSVTIGNSVESIDYYAFRECSNLGKIILGSSLKEISPYAFEECRKLIRIYCYAVYPPEADENSFANYNGYLYAPCDNLEEYSTNIVFGTFKNFECISSDEVSTDEDEVVVDPGTNDATISWPTEEDAETYSIVIYKDGEVFCTLTFNSNGQLVNIAFAPGRRGNHPVRYAEATANGYQFTVTGLDESTEYGYNLDVKDDSSKTIKSYEGEFTTNSATGVEDVVISDGTTQKLLRNGQLLIIRDGKTYNAQGAAL